MKLRDALQETGCALNAEHECITTVERLTDEQHLIMTRRGVCILQCRFVTLEEVERDPSYENRMWSYGRVQFVSLSGYNGTINGIQLLEYR
jgi:hypothetical protein